MVTLQNIRKLQSSLLCSADPSLLAGLRPALGGLSDQPRQQGILLSQRLGWLVLIHSESTEYIFETAELEVQCDRVRCAGAFSLTSPVWRLGDMLEAPLCAACITMRQASTEVTKIKFGSSEPSKVSPRRPISCTGAPAIHPSRSLTSAARCLASSASQLQWYEHAS